jgi:hypothetical protein
MEPSCFRHVLKSSRVLTIQYEFGGGDVGHEGSNLEFSKHRCDEPIMLSKWVKKGIVCTAQIVWKITDGTE